MEQLRNAKGFICDMDGVIYHGNKILPGVKEFVEWLYRENKQFLFLTNNSGKTPKELQEKLARMGLDVDEHHFYTSAFVAIPCFCQSSTSPSCTICRGKFGRAFCRRCRWWQRRWLLSTTRTR